MARLTVEVRSVRKLDKKGKEEELSDTLRLASWFSSLPPDGMAEQVLSRLSLGETLNDLDVVYWSTPDELRKQLLKQFQKHFGLKIICRFNKSFDFADEGWIKRDNPDGIENWQLLSPTRVNPHGVAELNRWIQGHFRKTKKRKVREHWAIQIGDEGIVVNDKVIHLRNGMRDCYFWSKEESGEEYLANGEIGCVAKGSKGFGNGFYSGWPMISFGYRSNDFGEDDTPLELGVRSDDP